MRSAANMLQVVPTPPGKPAVLLLLTAAVSGAIVLSRPKAATPDLRVWVFAEPHARVYRDEAVSFTRDTGKTVSVDLLPGRSMDVRLNALLNDPHAAVPDLVELEINSVGKYFRAAPDEIGLLPLNDFLDRDGLRDKFIASRFAPWTKRGRIFGVPLDVHPVTITYRRDLFAAAGVDLATATTWPRFADACRAFQEYWQVHGVRRQAIDLPTASSEILTVMLLQRGVELVDADGGLHFTDPRVADTLAFYATAVAGDRRIGGDATPGPGGWAKDLANGDVSAEVTPDWKVADLLSLQPSLAGRLAMMPLPRFDPTDAPTSTWGGTMVGIPRRCRQPELAWQLLKHLCVDESTAERRRSLGTLPALTSQQAGAIGSSTDAFFGGQPVGALYARLAAAVPPRTVTPYTALAAAQLARVLGKAIDHVRTDGEVGLRVACERWLAEAQAELSERIAFAKLQP